MKVAALILGVSSGLCSGAVASFASHALGGPFAQRFVSALTIATVASLFGGVLSIAAPTIGGVALLGSTAVWVYIWSISGEGPTYFSGLFILANGLAALLAFGAAAPPSQPGRPKPIYEPNDRPGDGPYSN